jgi:hypothetical protein
MPDNAQQKKKVNFDANILAAAFRVPEAPPFQ